MFKSFFYNVNALVNDHTSVNCGILYLQSLVESAALGILSHQEQQNMEIINF